MRFRLLTAAASSIVLFLIPVIGLAWEAARVAELAAGSPTTGCPVNAEKCPATSAVDMARLALAAESGCPVSTAQLLERAGLCPDPRTQALVVKAAAGDEEAKVELINLFKALGTLEERPADASTIA